MTNWWWSHSKLGWETNRRQLVLLCIKRFSNWQSHKQQTKFKRLFIVVKVSRNHTYLKNHHGRRSTELESRQRASAPADNPEGKIPKLMEPTRQPASWQLAIWVFERQRIINFMTIVFWFNSNQTGSCSADLYDVMMKSFTVYLTYKQMLSCEVVFLIRLTCQKCCLKWKKCLIPASMLFNNVY